MSENVQVEQIHPSASLVLRIVARHHYSGADANRRDVYLLRAGEGAHECLFWNLGCTLAVVPTLEFLARNLAAEVEYDPPGNCEPGWTWPAEPVAAPAKPKADAALSFD